MMQEPLTTPRTPEDAARAAGRALALLDRGAITPEEKTLLEDTAALLRELPIRPDSDPALLGQTQPFRVAYDMRFGGKREARGVAELFRGLRRSLWPQGAPEPADPRFPDYAAALADTAARMDPQLYEHWRALADLLLEAAQAALRGGAACLGDPRVAHALTLGARIGAIDPERYGAALKKVGRAEA